MSEQRRVFILPGLRSTTQVLQPPAAAQLVETMPDYFLHAIEGHLEVPPDTPAFADGALEVANDDLGFHAKFVGFRSHDCETAFQCIALGKPIREVCIKVAGFWSVVKIAKRFAAHYLRAGYRGNLDAHSLCGRMRFLLVMKGSPEHPDLVPPEHGAILALSYTKEPWDRRGFEDLFASELEACARLGLGPNGRPAERFSPAGCGPAFFVYAKKPKALDKITDTS